MNAALGVEQAENGDATGLEWIREAGLLTTPAARVYRKVHML